MSADIQLRFHVHSGPGGHTVTQQLHNKTEPADLCRLRPQESGLILQPLNVTVAALRLLAGLLRRAQCDTVFGQRFFRRR